MLNAGSTLDLRVSEGLQNDKPMVVGEMNLAMPSYLLSLAGFRKWQAGSGRGVSQSEQDRAGIGVSRSIGRMGGLSRRNYGGIVHNCMDGARLKKRSTWPRLMLECSNCQLARFTFKVGAR
ncbi:hypothetical protein J1614_006852 [Plenodomus biglobosus]|nr:hypothetical protein J1614_006852 [Plenodomus biglobosus]